ncbi:uncharacterized protein LODBEIA_P50680 [Lodderomyces beijingensis]|uniref:Endonuclease/exonuclease/phosphatase domain-containing protein n=1 Tax=Lodderomyces beijingensis TaxID=1775926 RepID=A0ABP0ZRS6_9ASCO
MQPDERTPLVSLHHRNGKPSSSSSSLSVGNFSPRASSSYSKLFRPIITALALLSILLYTFHSRYPFPIPFLSRQSAYPSLGPSLTLRLYTNNIRFDNFQHPDRHEKPWSKRRVQSINSMEFNTISGHANVICLQEVLSNQLTDIIRGLNEGLGVDGEWHYCGVGRTDGVAQGEFAPVIYKKSDFIVLENATFWLSDTPAVPSKGWDAALERIVTMVTLQSRVNPLIKFNVFNTHYDHRGKVARRKSSQLIVDKMKHYNSYPSFLCGDFNTEPSDEPYRILTEAGFKDGRITIDSKFAYGHESTFTGFDLDKEPDSIIDYIWSPYFTKSAQRSREKEVEEKNQMINYYNLDHHEYYDIVLKSFGILGNFFHGFYFSDHRPVVATYELTRTRLI